MPALRLGIWSREGPKKLLENFKGYLQTDGYKVYDLFAREKDITHVNCMAHARRGFEKALDYDRQKAEYAMNIFQKLYAIERNAREQNLTPEQRHALRLDEALPLLNELGKWFVEAIKETLNLSWTLVGLIIATLTLTGSAQQVTGLATVITLFIWLLTIGFRKGE